MDAPSVEKPKFLGVNEEKFWRLRYDPDQFLTHDEIGEQLGTKDHKLFTNALAKLKWNWDHGLITNETRELVQLAATTTGVVIEDNPYLFEELAARRARQINWERNYRRRS